MSFVGRAVCARADKPKKRVGRASEAAKSVRLAD
jgi:hypothetical protein